MEQGKYVFPTLFNQTIDRDLAQAVFHRCFFLYGNIHDEFCTPDCQVVDLERLLYRHLRELGFERVIAYHGSDKFYCFDRQTQERAQNFGRTPSSQVAAPEQSQASRKRSVVAGPLGHRKIGTPRQSSPTTEQPLPISPEDGRFPIFERMADANAVPFLNQLMTETHIRTALLITNLHDLVLDVNDDARRQLVNHLERWQRLGSGNHNIAVFLIPFQSIEPIRQAIAHIPQWRILENMLFTDAQQQTLGSNVILVGAPRRDEIRNALNRVRLLRQLPVDWPQFGGLADQISQRWLNRNVDEGVGKLTDLLRTLNSVTSLDANGLRSLTGETDDAPALQRLQNLRGLEVVAEQVAGIIQHVTASLASTPVSQAGTPTSLNVQRLQPRPPNTVKGKNLHIALQGRPGTGKTTSARLIAEAYRDAGLLESGHLVEVTYEHLVSGYVGQTPIQTAQFINDAMGGVLFIDEVQRFIAPEGSNDFGRQAIQTLVKAMEDHMGEFALIVATYPEEMDSFLDLDAGLRRRFSQDNIISIPDYPPDVLEHIFRQMAGSQGLALSPELEQGLGGFFHNCYVDRDTKTFGNAGYVRELLRGMDRRRLQRIMHDKLPTDDPACQMLVVADIPPAQQAHFKPARSDDPDTVMYGLNQLVGLHNVKELVTAQLQHLQVQQLRGGGANLAPGHYLFTGNPGTGKTTVARLMGQVFRSMGLLKRGHVVEVKRADLVAGYVGQTALKTREKIREAFDGILFIDEAYQLQQGHETDFGHEAIEALVADMENERHRLCIIAAGYPVPMQRFIDSNPGLASRFTADIPFKDYNAGELVEIFKQQTHSAGLTLAEGMEEALLQVFQYMTQHKGRHFGNGREARKLLGTLQARQNARILQTLIAEPEKKDDQAFLNALWVEDIPVELRGQYDNQ